ncbi:unnamed protein product, partial [Heligmosomoides polygyrus]|uniref:COesterase domain-containing protein n=1 Tax=Heligmosomoides polygyrus TaxID=6339 RepID=A0A183GP25_HELPZ
VTSNNLSKAVNVRDIERNKGILEVLNPAVSQKGYMETSQFVAYGFSVNFLFDHRALGFSCYSVMAYIEEVARSRNDRSSEPLDSESIRHMLENGELDTMRWEDDGIGVFYYTFPLLFSKGDKHPLPALPQAASNRRLPYDKLTNQEIPGCD